MSVGLIVRDKDKSGPVPMRRGCSVSLLESDVQDPARLRFVANDAQVSNISRSLRF